MAKKGSSRKIGADNENLVCRYYETQHYNVWKPPMSRAFKQKYSSTDMFNLFDIIVASSFDVGFIQVKTAGWIASKVDEAIEKFELPQNCWKEYWIFKKDKILIINYYKDFDNTFTRGQREYQLDEFLENYGTPKKIRTTKKSRQSSK